MENIKNPQEATWEEQMLNESQVKTARGADCDENA